MVVVVAPEVSFTFFLILIFIENIQFVHNLFVHLKFSNFSLGADALINELGGRVSIPIGVLELSIDFTLIIGKAFTGFIFLEKTLFYSLGQRKAHNDKDKCEEQPDPTNRMALSVDLKRKGDNSQGEKENRYLCQLDDSSGETIVKFVKQGATMEQVPFVYPILKHEDDSEGRGANGHDVDKDGNCPQLNNVISVSLCDVELDVLKLLIEIDLELLDIVIIALVSVEPPDCSLADQSRNI